MKQMIVKVDDDFTDIPEGLNLQTAGQLVGSKSWYNKILILCVSPLGTLALGDQFDNLGLGWEIIAVEDEPLNGDEFTSYMNDIIETDEEGEQVGSVPFSDVSTIQTFAGKRWTL